MGQKGPGAAAQHLGQRIGKRPWLESLKTLLSVTAYHSFSGEVEARTSPRYAALPLTRRHQLPRIALYTATDPGRVNTRAVLPLQAPVTVATSADHCATWRSRAPSAPWEAFKATKIQRFSRNSLGIRSIQARRCSYIDNAPPHSKLDAGSIRYRSLPLRHRGGGTGRWLDARLDLSSSSPKQ